MFELDTRLKLNSYYIGIISICIQKVISEYIE